MDVRDVIFVLVAGVGTIVAGMGNLLFPKQAMRFNMRFNAFFARYEIPACPPVTAGMVVLCRLSGLVTDETVQRFAVMHKLNELSFDDRWKTTTGAGLKSLLALPYIHCLGVPEHWTVTDEEKDIVRRHGPTVDLIAPYLDACEPAR